MCDSWYVRVEVGQQLVGVVLSFHLGFWNQTQSSGLWCKGTYLQSDHPGPASDVLYVELV